MTDLATRFLPDARWQVLTGDKGMAALVVGDGEADPQMAAMFMAQHDVKVVLLDFDDDGPSIIEFDEGNRKRRRGHPAAFLSAHGIVAPGHEPRPRSPVRSVSVLDGAAASAARKTGLDHTCVDHPRGTLITGDNLFVAAPHYAKKFGGPVYTVNHNTRDGHVWCVVTQRGKRTQQFDPNDPDAGHYDNIDNVLGETTLEGICRVLEIPIDLLRGPNE